MLLPGVDDKAPGFDPEDDANYLYLPIEGDDSRRFFIFLSAKKGCDMIKQVMYNKMPKEESCQDALPLNNGL